MSKGKKKTIVRKNHARRNISLVATLVVVVIIVVALSVALSPAPTYVMVVHVYDTTKGPAPQTLLDFTETIAVHNVTVTVSGPNYPSTTRGPAPEGIVAWGPDDHLQAGSYQITVSANHYANFTQTYVLGPNCFDKTTNPDQCHPLVPMIPSP